MKQGTPRKHSPPWALLWVPTSPSASLPVPPAVKVSGKTHPLAPWPGLPLLIVRPQVSVSTAKAYAAIDARGSRPENTTALCVKALETRDKNLLLSSLSNDFESALFPTHPILCETARTLRALSRPVLMTGSGSAFFLLWK